MPNSIHEYDIAIVGGGVSGVYSGWRLLSDHKDSPLLREWAGGGKLKVALIEESGRIGGRLLSARAPGFPDTVCELGGMRYMSTQPLMSSLVENELKLPHYTQVVSQPNNLVYLRGKQLRFEQTQTAANLPYDLSWAEAQQLKPGNDPSNLLGWAIGKILPDLSNFSGEELEKYLQNAVVDGTPLYQHGFWNLLARSMSSEAWQLARAMVGYDVLGSNANAVDLTKEFFDFTPGVQYFLLNGGYDLVPWTLLQRFQQADGQVMLNTRLAGFDKATLDGGRTGVELHFHGKREPIKARAIILAMPKRALQMLKPEGPVLDLDKAPRVKALLSSVEGVPLFKLFLVYPDPWWQAVGVSQGRTLTDLPIRQCYYWPTNTGSGKKQSTGGLLMAYNDQSSVDFWGGLTGFHNDAHKMLGAPDIRLFERSAKMANVQGGDNFDQMLRKNWDDHPAPHEMVAEMHRELLALHDTQYAPDPVDAAFMDWSADPYGGGVHFWNRGYKSWEIVEEMTKPVGDFPCYICGEAYSTVQTWAEGALQTAEIVLQKHLKLPAPKWISKPKAGVASTS